MLRKQAAKVGAQWHQYLSGVLWPYHNTPHSSTEESHFLLFGFDCCSPIESALLPPKSLRVTDVSDYREQMVLSLSTTKSLAMKANREAQQWYKLQYYKTVRTSQYRVGNIVLVYFPQDETGKSWKLSHPWHGPYQVISLNDPDITLTKIYFLDDPSIQVHQSRVQHYPPPLPSEFYWYGAERSRPGRPSKKKLKQ